MDGLLETGLRDLRKAPGDLGILERHKFDSVTCGLLPALDPPLAEVAVAVENHDGLGRRSSDLDVGLHVLTTVNPVSEQGERQSASKRAWSYFDFSAVDCGCFRLTSVCISG